MNIVFVGFVAATYCAIQSTLAASIRGDRVDISPETAPQSIIPEDSSKFLATLREILSEDFQDPTSNQRSLQDGPDCGEVEFPCTHGAVCKPAETKGGADWCFCDVANGYINDPASDTSVIALYDLQGYRSCIQADECSQMANNVCARDEGGGCEDLDPENGKYMCFCKAGYLADISSVGAHGPKHCEQVNECLVFENICGDGKVCIDTPGSFQCRCEDDLIQTQNGDCLDPPAADKLEPCDPLSGDHCVEPERECDKELKKCICIPGWIQPAGAGGQCQREQQVNECEAQTDMNCDRRGRGGPNPRSKCIDREPYDDDGNPLQGYTCECLPPYYDAPNAIRGTNCLEPKPTPAPTSVVVVTPVPQPVSAEPTPPGPALHCTTFVCVAPFSFCAAERNRCECQRGYIKSLGSSFACEAICLADADCLTDEYCFESRCTTCDAGAFREVASADGCVNPCVSTNMGVPGPCPIACKSLSSTEFTCLCDGNDAHCLQDDKCDTDTGACIDCPDEMPYRNANSQGGCVDPCNPQDPDETPPCRALSFCESSSSISVTCTCSTDSDCLKDTECNVEGGTGACQDCADGFFRAGDSMGGCVNPCQPSSGGTPCPSVCVSSSPTDFTCECPNDVAMECPPNNTCNGGSCSDCPMITPFRPEGQAECVQCLSNTNCLADETCGNDGACEVCPMSTPFRPDGQAECVCLFNINCPVDQACGSDGSCADCPTSASRRAEGQVECVQCLSNTDCPANQACDSDESCVDCPAATPFRTPSQAQCACVGEANTAASGGQFYIVNIGNGKVVDLDQGSCNDTTNIQLGDPICTPAQHFYWGESQSIMNSKCNKALDILYNGCHNTANLQLVSFKGNVAQTGWVLDNDGYIENSYCGTVIDLADNIPATGTNIQMYERAVTPAHKWRFEYINEF